MSTLGLWSFGPFDTTFLPAAGLWTSSAGVTIVAGGGRSGSADDNCAAFDTALGAVLSRTVTPTATGVSTYTATYGAAFRILTLTASATLASIWTANSRFDLVVDSTGALTLRQASNTGVILGTICQTIAETVPIGTGGFYVEVQIILGTATVCQINVSDQFGDMNPIVQGTLVTADAGPYTTFRLGGGSGESPATWRVADVYLNDGVAAIFPIAYKGRLIYNDSFFGNTHVETFYPTADGTNLSSGNTPWVPNSGATQYTQIDEHPPDEDATYDSADTSQQASTFGYQSPRPAPFGRVSCLGMAPIYALQWIGRLRVIETPWDIVPLVREIVTGTLAGDLVAVGPTQAITATNYLYYPWVTDRNPIQGDPWSFAIFFPISTGGFGTTEFGLRLE